MNVFDDYDSAWTFAYNRAKTTKQDNGIEKIRELSGKIRWKVVFLPRPDKSFGLDARIERVIAP